MRVALYWVPSLDDPLYRAGVAWLGRDAETGARVPQPPVPGIADFTRRAARYGLHATLQPPMRLATAYSAFRAAAHAMAASCQPFDLPPVSLCEIGGFLALRESAPCPALHALADTCILTCLTHRLPPDGTELARRRAGGLTPRQAELLRRYFYPYVLDEWFFHITLTDQTFDTATRMAACAHFSGVLERTRRMDSICICTEREGDFLIAERLALGEERNSSF
jgi:hypothetical protein